MGQPRLISYGELAPTPVSPAQSPGSFIQLISTHGELLTQVFLLLEAILFGLQKSVLMPRLSNARLVPQVISKY